MRLLQVRSVAVFKVVCPWNPTRKVPEIILGIFDKRIHFCGDFLADILQSIC